MTESWTPEVGEAAIVTSSAGAGRNDRATRVTITRVLATQVTIDGYGSAGDKWSRKTWEPVGASGGYGPRATLWPADAPYAVAAMADHERDALCERLRSSAERYGRAHRDDRASAAATLRKVAADAIAHLDAEQAS